MKLISFNEELYQRQSSGSYHSFEDDIVGVYDQVKPLLLSRQLVLVLDVRPAAMVLHYLTHANAGAQGKELVRDTKVADHTTIIPLSSKRLDETWFGLP